MGYPVKGNCSLSPRSLITKDAERPAERASACFRFQPGHLIARKKLWQNLSFSCRSCVAWGESEFFPPPKKIFRWGAAPNPAKLERQKIQMTKELK